VSRPEPVKPEDLKPGDSVEVTLRGTFCYMREGRMEVLWRDGIGSRCINASELAHATIVRLPPPVDPDLILAREVCAARQPTTAAIQADYRSGRSDGSASVALALAAIKAADARRRGDG